MPTPTKWDTLLYLSFTEGATFTELSDTLRHNILFENLNNRMLYKRVHELINAGLVIRKKQSTRKRTIYCLNHGTPSLNNFMAFLLWSRKEGLDYNNLLTKWAQDILLTLIEHGPTSLKTLHEHTGISKSSLTKYIKILNENRFVRTLKRKPLYIDINLNDRTLFYLTLLHFSPSLGKMTGKYRELIQEIDIIKEGIKDSDELLELIH